MKLNNVIFYLLHVANVWYKNHETDFQTCSAFKASFVDVFGHAAAARRTTFARSAQHPGVTFTSYIEEVIDLCKRVDASMTEAAKFST